MKALAEVKKDLMAWRDKHSDELKEKSVALVEANFDGSGDEGSLREVTAQRSLEPGTLDPADLEDVTRQELWDIIAELDVSDYDNEGGGADIRFVIETGILTRSTYYYMTERQYEPREEA
jgi:hypothetical protein